MAEYVYMFTAHFGPNGSFLNLYTLWRANSFDDSTVQKISRCEFEELGLQNIWKICQCWSKNLLWLRLTYFRIQDRKCKAAFWFCLEAVTSSARFKTIEKIETRISWRLRALLELLHSVFEGRLCGPKNSTHQSPKPFVSGVFLKTWGVQMSPKLLPESPELWLLSSFFERYSELDIKLFILYVT